jgi:hypothetical protein
MILFLILLSEGPLIPKKLEILDNETLCIINGCTSNSFKYLFSGDNVSRISFLLYNVSKALLEIFLETTSQSLFLEANKLKLFLLNVITRLSSSALMK